ncbi:hypothetical protein EZV61_00075 [Corallincola luteus]|uniref:Der GTPase-activating protein YihI n=1 Tax=Corallincola luteus TaxID=1775177 RepID=A0ABY2ANE3_9GAMM|nr:GTPase-activating protein [Corallincola luteus]TCI04411.1 hypothetical protein EZV61_00075 [Corallincola luteus]
MSRKRKTRKVGSLAPSLKPKAIAKEERSKLQKRAKNRKGLKAGHRQVLESNKARKGAGSGQAKLDDAVAEKLGSKKPVALAPAETKPVQQPQAVKKPSKPAVPVIDTQTREVVDIESLSLDELETALDLLEQDPVFNQLLDLVDEGKALSAEQQTNFDHYVAEHERLSAALGITDEEEPEDTGAAPASSEDELWNNFNQGESLLKQFQKDED